MKRQIRIFEILDEKGATIGFAPTIQTADKIKHLAKAGARIQPVNVPLWPAGLSDFLTQKAGGAS